MAGQFLGCFVGAMLGYFFLGDHVDHLPYINARLSNGIMGVLIIYIFE